MKRIASIGLILVMSLECCYKLGVLTYFQLNQDYIAEVLCINKEKPATMCHGQCFLKRNLQMTDDASSDETTVPPGSQKVELPVFLVTENYYTSLAFTLSEASNSRYLINTSSTYLQAPFHPPA